MTFFTAGTIFTIIVLIFMGLGAILALGVMTLCLYEFARKLGLTE